MLEKIIGIIQRGIQRRIVHVYTKDEYQNLQYSHGNVASFTTNRPPKKGDRVEYSERDGDGVYNICFRLDKVHRIRKSNRYFCEVSVENISPSTQ